VSLLPGTRLGPYEVAAQIGAGGMGEVYRATDTNLKRHVAIKVLPTSVAEDPERLARFHREAEMLAALNHPNIAHIHGLEKSDGTVALVMELVEGPTLADRIAKGAVPIDEALPIAKQILDALEAAHGQGIVHRDLKPANIKVRPDGTAKILDFGLAKALEPMATMAATVSMSPTITTPAMTQAGLILGTAAYMSPEQAVGKPADKRSDLWAFGVVLLEMLTGRQVFDGETVSHVLASVLKDQPDWTALPARTPASIHRLLRRCLEKDCKRRLDSAGDARLEIDDALVSTPDGTAVPLSSVDMRRPLWRRALAMSTAVMLGALLAGTIAWIVWRPRPPLVVRTTIPTSGTTALSVTSVDPDITITPDGSRLVYRSRGQLLVRALNQFEPTVLGGLGLPRGLFISPDGQWIGFFDGLLLKKVAITGGPAVTIASVDGGGPRGATWGPDGTIIFATSNPTTGLQRVSSAGGDPIVLTRPDRSSGAQDHFWPEFLPGGNAVLFTIFPVAGAVENAQIAVLDLRTGSSKVVIRGGSHARYVSTGHLLYGASGTLRAVAFDLARLEVVGTPAPVLDGVLTTTPGATDVAVSANGSLAYVPGKAGAGGQQTIVSVDRQGRASRLAGIQPGSYRDVRVSPDGAHLAVATIDDVWIYDLARATLSRLTTDPSNDTRPLWTPDGRRVVFSSNRNGYNEIYWRPADGTGSDERLLSRAKDLIDLRADNFSSDGRQLLFTDVTSRIRCTIGQMAVEDPSDVKVLVTSEFCNDYPTVSPDGRWMAYHSNLSGHYEIYVERYPELGDRQLISTNGGWRPIWSHDGREVFFADPDNRQILTVPVQSGTTLVAGRPTVLFDFPIATIGGSHPYDVSRDGRFFIIGREESDSGQLSNVILIQNWFEELKQRVPLK